MSATNPNASSAPPSSSLTSTGTYPSLTLDLPRESKRSLILRRDRLRDEAGAGYELEADVLSIHLDGVGQIGGALRINATRVWFEPEGQGIVPYGKVGCVTLKTADREFGPFQAKFGIEALNDDVHAVAQLEGLSESDGRQLVAFMLESAERGWSRPVRPMAAVQTDITEPVRIQIVLESLAHRSAAAVLSSPQETVDASLVHFDPLSGRLVWALSNAAEMQQALNELTVEVAGYNCVYVMRFDDAQRSGQSIITGVPSRVDYSRYRRYRRVSPTDAAHVRFEHPLWAGIPHFDRLLLDVSFGGIAFAAEPLKDALYVGLRVDLIEVITDLAEIVLLRGTVRSIINLPDGTTTCGLSVEPRTPDYAESWTSFVMRALNQTTAPGDDRVEELWELFTDSGYFNLSGKTPGEFDSLAQSFRSVIDRTKTRPWLYYNSVWPSGNKIEASISVTKVYRQTWILHQVAKRKATQGNPRARNILRDVYLRAIEYMQADSACRWLLTYGEAHVRWMQKSHYAFAEHFEPTGTAISRAFRLMEADCRDLLVAPGSAAYRIAAAAPDERQFILEVLAKTLPKPYIEACDLVPETFDLAAVKQVWADLGLERDREVWVARRGSMPVAAAILEVGETGTNLFRLLDSIRLVELDPGGAAAFGTLLEKAKRWFLARGKDSFVYMHEHPSQEHVVQQRLRDLGEGRVWIIPSDLLPDFSELICELTSNSVTPQPGRRAVRSDSAVPGPVSVRGSFHPRPLGP